MTYLGNIVYNSQRSELRKIVLKCRTIDLEFHSFKPYIYQNSISVIKSNYL